MRASPPLSPLASAPRSAALDMAFDIEQGLVRASPALMRGRVNRVVGLLIEASGVQARVGELCELATPGEPALLAEVVGFAGSVAVLTPLGPTHGLSAQTEVVPMGHGLVCNVGDGVIGRVLDALGRPIDEGGTLGATVPVPVHRAPPDPLQRRPIERPFATGVRALDGLLTLGEGQRLGVFAPPGIGKSTLLGQIARGSTADVNVIALIGERGREVNEFLRRHLGPDGQRRSVLVVSTSDRPPMERIKSAYVATAIAEHFRDRGRRVLLVVDSLTRLARAQREIGLACGEPPTRRSYPPSIFSLLPQLLERAGMGTTGSLTAVYAVLTEGDEDNDPIAEETRAILDGHVVLSRKLAAAGQFPAIDVLASVSRVMAQVVAPEQRAAAARFRALAARYQELELLIQLGEYRPGSDALADQAARLRPAMTAFLAQGSDTHEPFARTEAALRHLVKDAA